MSPVGRDLLGDGMPAGAFGHISLHHQGFDSELLQLRGQRVRFVRAGMIVDGDVGPFLGQAQRNCPPYAACRTGDQRILTR